MQKLLDFGAPQVFLLEAFIVEAGFSPVSQGKIPKQVRSSVARKLEQIGDPGCGFATLPIEQIPGYAENATGILWPAETIKRGEIRPMRPPFSRLVAVVEEYAKKARATNFGSVVTYCNLCKGLTAFAGRGPYVCGNCKAPLI